MLEAFAIEAKVDTGAYRSVLHCISCREEKRDGQPLLVTVFNLDGLGEKTFEFPRFYEKLVRSSSGHAEIVRFGLRQVQRQRRSGLARSRRKGFRNC